MKNRRPHLTAIALVSLFASQLSHSGTIETVTAPLLILAAINQQSIAVAKSTSVTTTEALVKSWMDDGSAALQDYNISNPHLIDTPCPVKLILNGPLGTFNGFEDIQTKDQYSQLAAATTGYNVKLVSRIFVCGRQSDPFGAFPACYDVERRQIVISTNFGTDSLTLAHEYGHDKNLPDRYKQGEEGFLMFHSIVAGVEQNIVDGLECLSFSNPK